MEKIKLNHIANELTISEALQIQPISNFCYQGSISNPKLAKRIGQIVVGVNNKEIRNRLKTPLKTSVDI